MRREVCKNKRKVNAGNNFATHGVRGAKAQKRRVGGCGGELSNIKTPLS